MILMTQQNCREQISNILSALERAIELEEYANMLLGLVRQAKREGSISQCDADQMLKQINQISESTSKTVLNITFTEHRMMINSSLAENQTCQK